MTPLKQRPDIAGDIKLNRLYTQFGELLREIEKKELTPPISESINQHISEVNISPLTGNELLKLVKQKQSHIIKVLEKELKIVPKNYYRNIWMVLGMSAFGLPLGVAFGVSLGNLAFLGVGLPIGMGMGVAVGTSMDKKAFEEGRQLDVVIKY